MSYARREPRGRLSPAAVALLCVALVGATEAMGGDPPKGRSTKAPTALVQVSMQRDSMIAPKRNTQLKEEFRVFKATQAQLIKSPFVLMAALRKPGIARLAIVQREADDPVGWLQDHLKVSYPGDAEIMRVSLKASDSAEAAKLVNAVVDAYVSEIVEEDRSMQHRKLADLDNVLARKEQEIRKRRTVLKRLADELGTSDKKTLSLKMQSALQQLNQERQELTRVRSDLRHLMADHKVLQARLARIQERDASDQPTSPTPPMAAELSRLSEQLSRVITKLADTKVSQELQDDLKKIRQRVDHLQGRVSGAQRVAELKERIADLTVKIKVFAEDTQSLAATVEARQQEFERIGRSTVELEMMQAELENLEAVRNTIATKRETLEVETNARPRIRPLQRAEPGP